MLIIAKVLQIKTLHMKGGRDKRTYVLKPLISTLPKSKP